MEESTAADFRTPALHAARGIAVLAAMILTGVAIAPFGDPASVATRPARFSFAKAEPRELATEGMLVSAGGLRTLAADAAWLRAYVMSEKQDRGSCSAYARLACALAPENSYFREGYANWLALDFPHWTITALGGYMQVPENVRNALFKTDALAALDYLKGEMARNPDEYRYPILAGQIVIIKFKDIERGAAYDRQAAGTPAKPWPPALRYANHLANNGKQAEAVAWMKAYAARCRPGTINRALADEWLAPVPDALKKETK